MPGKRAYSTRGPHAEASCMKMCVELRNDLCAEHVDVPLKIGVFVNGKPLDDAPELSLREQERAFLCFMFQASSASGWVNVCELKFAEARDETLLIAQRRARSNVPCWYAKLRCCHIHLPCTILRPLYVVGLMQVACQVTVHLLNSFVG